MELLLTIEMPEHKRIQGPEETRNPLLFLQTEEKSHKPTVSVTPVSKPKHFRTCSVNSISGCLSLLDTVRAPGNVYDNDTNVWPSPFFLFFYVILLP